ncbi:MAG TPA: RNA polymerase sigma factor [Pyrinomonadaceae bacterium]|nr:RNA polymerase sigma factor [Pyrinomonadaceae bacterium]
MSAKEEPRPAGDHALARAAAGGDASAFEELYRRHNRRVYSLCMRMTQNVAEAEDLTQDVFVQLMRNVGSFRGESAFTTWLHRLTTNLVLMHFRKMRGRREQTTEEGVMPEAPTVGGSVGGQAPAMHDRVALGNALRRLPPGYRAVFVLHDIEGYEHEEVGRLLGCAAGTSKSQLHKARARLRRLLTQEPRREEK